MPRRDSPLSRLTTALAVVLAAAVPCLLFLTWGDYLDPSPIRPFKGTALQGSFQIELIALSALTVAVGVFGLLRPMRPAVLLVCCVAMAAEVVIIAAEWNNPSALSRNVGWRWANGTVVLAFALSGVAIAAWLGLLVSGALGRKKCPDCAEKVRRGAIDCPRCGYHFSLPPRLKRCEQCERPVKAEARVCRYCKHRFVSP